MMIRCLNVPVRIPHLQTSNLNKGFRPPPGPLGIVSGWPSALGYSTKCVAAASGREKGNGSDDEERRRLLEVYSILKSELLHDPTCEFTEESRQWLHQMLDYNVPRGKLGRASETISYHKILLEGKEISDKDNFLACVLGWCIQWLQADVLIIDDIIDNSDTRRGQTCWCRLPRVGIIAINDAMLLQTHIFIILKKHFREEPYYADLLDLFNEVACGLILAGERLDDHLDVNNILTDISIYIQSVNDYLDCYGDPKITGKIGTDIEEGKCSALIIKALEHADEEQMKILYENYGKDDPACVARVKEIYASLDIQNMFKEYGKNKFEELMNAVETHPNKTVQAIWTSYLGKITRIQ